MAQVRCVICNEYGDSDKMYFCDVCHLWMHYSCAGGGYWADAKCVRCKKRLG